MNWRVVGTLILWSSTASAHVYDAQATWSYDNGVLRPIQPWKLAPPAVGQYPLGVVPPTPTPGDENEPCDVANGGAATLPMLRWRPYCCGDCNGDGHVDTAEATQFVAVEAGMDYLGNPIVDRQLGLPGVWPPGGGLGWFCEPGAICSGSPFDPTNRTSWRFAACPQDCNFDSHVDAGDHAEMVQNLVRGCPTPTPVVGAAPIAPGPFQLDRTSPADTPILTVPYAIEVERGWAGIPAIQNGRVRYLRAQDVLNFLNYRLGEIHAAYLRDALVELKVVHVRLLRRLTYVHTVQVNGQNQINVGDAESAAYWQRLYPSASTSARIQHIRRAAFVLRLLPGGSGGGAGESGCTMLPIHAAINFFGDGGLSSPATFAWSADTSHVIAHEIGHALGLVHASCWSIPEDQCPADCPTVTAFGGCPRGYPYTVMSYCNVYPCDAPGQGFPYIGPVPAAVIRNTLLRDFTSCLSTRPSRLWWTDTWTAGADQDGDHIPEWMDNCPWIANPHQEAVRTFPGDACCVPDASLPAGIDTYMHTLCEQSRRGAPTPTPTP